MAPALRDCFIIATLLVLVWRFLPPGQAFLATMICAAALWVTFHPVFAANLATEIARLY
ncbi:MAG TPA: hypothetical protein VJT33_13205 [bacterium]|nr:hypothetical protein [bacterium]